MEDSIQTLKDREKPLARRTDVRAGGLLVAAGSAMLVLTLSGVEILPFVLPFAILGGLGTLFMWPAIQSEPDNLRKGRMLAGPGALLITIGAIAFMLTLFDRPEMMAYAWTLLPLGFTLGLMYAQRHDAEHPIHNKGAKAVRLFGWMFIGFGLFFELIAFGTLGPWWPVMIIIAGVLMMRRQRRQRHEAEKYTHV